MVNMKTPLVNQIIRGLLIAFVLSIVITVVVNWGFIGDYGPYFKKTETSKLMGMYDSALNKYYDEYGSYPVSCTNIEELVYVLKGHCLRGCNSNSIKFLSGLPNRKLTRDGFGTRLELMKNEDGTNLIIRSIGNSHFDDKGRLLYGYGTMTIDTATITKEKRDQR